MSKCPCGSALPYEKCCAPYLEGKKLAPTAEAVMRARYTAFTLGNVDFLMASHDPATRTEINQDDLKKWSTESKWHGLSVKKTDAGGADDERGSVEFVAEYSLNGTAQSHHEVAEFIRQDKQWFFTDGKLVHQSYQRAQPKVGRNDLCPCGSGKKYKKCCLV